MKSVLFGALSAVASLLAIASGAQATTMAQQTIGASKLIPSTPPVTLVQLARQGYLTQQGVLSGRDLIFAVQANQITPEALIQAGIQAGRISPEVLQNQGYANSVADQLYDLAIISISE